MMKPMWILFYLLVSLAYAEEKNDSPPAAMQSINQIQVSPRELYDQGQFQKALDLLMENGLNTAADYYNVGNCYYRLGQLGRALAYYEKALTLAPGNGDIKYNRDLALENLNRTGALPKNSSLWNGKIVPFSKRIPQTWLMLAYSGISLLLGLVCFRTRKSRKLWPIIATWACFTLVFTTALFAQRVRIGKVISETAVAFSGPKETFTELFRLPAGTSVELTSEKRDHWRQVKFSQNKVGWIPEKDLLEL